MHQSLYTRLVETIAVAGLGLVAVGWLRCPQAIDRPRQEADTAVPIPPVAVRPVREVQYPAHSGESTTTRTAARELSVAFRMAAERVLPAVVAIEVSGEVPPALFPGFENTPPQREPNWRQTPFDRSPFLDFFPWQPSKGGPPYGAIGPRSRPQPTGFGSGMITELEGLVLTCHHVVAGGASIKVRLHDGREFPARTVWSDPEADIAVLQIDGAQGLTAARLGDSDKAAIGDWVLALGQPFGLESTVTAGIISGTHRSIGLTPQDDFLQTDAAINPGNSGGPLVNLDGEVIGINTAISSRSGGNDGIGFAVPINTARRVLDRSLSPRLSCSSGRDTPGEGCGT